MTVTLTKQPSPVDKVGGSPATTSIPVNRDARLKALRRQLDTRILVLDGAYGTTIQNHELDEAGFRGDRFPAAPLSSALALPPLRCSPHPGSSKTLTEV